MIEADAILAAIQADVADDTVRLAAADWIQEHGDEARASFIRVQVKIARIEQILKEYARSGLNASDCGSVSDRWCPECGDCLCSTPEERLNDSQCPLHNELSTHAGVDHLWKQLEDLREQETELFNPLWLPHCNGGLREWYFSDFPVNHVPDRPYSFVVRRGFVSKLIVACDDFFPIAWEFGKDPLEHIHLSDFTHEWRDQNNLTGPVRIRVDNVVSRHLRRQGSHAHAAHYLPPALRTLLKGGDSTYLAYGDRDYNSYEAMQKDLCQACIAFTRLPRKS